MALWDGVIQNTAPASSSFWASSLTPAAPKPASFALPVDTSTPQLPTGNALSGFWGAVGGVVNNVASTVSTALSGPKDFANALFQSIQTRSFTPLINIEKSHLASEMEPVNPFTGAPATASDKFTIPRLAYGLIGAFSAHGEGGAREFAKRTTPESIPGTQKTTGAPALTPGALPKIGEVPAGEASPNSNILKNTVDLSVTGSNESERLQSAITQSERIKNELSVRGKDALAAGNELSANDVKLAERLEQGTPITDLAKEAENPNKFVTFMNKVTDYYDFRLAADRAAGGDTRFVPNYLPHNWDLSDPAQLARFNELATQRGLLPYNGFRSQPRVFKSYAEGEALGFTRTHETILGDLRQDYQGASNIISRQALRTGLNAAAPGKVSAQGMGRTTEGKSFVNSNIPGLEGLSYHPSIDARLKGYAALTNQDVFSLMREKGFRVGELASYPKAWEAISDAGLPNIVGTLYDRVSAPMKHFLLNFSGFHSINISANYTGASIFNPIKGFRGLLQSVPSFMSERITSAVIDSFKKKLVTGQKYSVFDAGLRAGVNMDRGLPATGIARLNPFTALSRAMFDRQLYTLKLNLVDQVFGPGKIIPTSPQGLELGKEINLIMGEMNNHTMNISPNVQKWLSRILLAPHFTESKYSIIGRAFSQNPTKSLAARAVIGKSLVMGTLATLGTLLATGQFPNLQQLLLNYTIAPSSQTNLTNPKGQKIDVTYPQTFVTEPISALRDPIHYGEARLAPALSTGIKGFSNQDYYGNPIVDPNKPESATAQRIKNLGQGVLPIGVQAVLSERQGKQTPAQAALGIAGLRTKASASDPTVQNYKQIDDAKAAIAAIAPDDPNRLSKMQAIFNRITFGQRKSLQYQELMAGVKTKGVYLSETERKYFQVQDLLAQGKKDEAAALTAAMTPKEYTTYKAIKTRLTNEALFKRVQDLLIKGDAQGAGDLTSQMSKSQYQSYQTWKANNPLPDKSQSNNLGSDILGLLTGASVAQASTGGKPAPNLLETAWNGILDLLSSHLSADTTAKTRAKDQLTSTIAAGIANNETGGVDADPYGFSKGDGAKGQDLGKYQINTQTLKELSRRYLGRLVAPEEFLATPKLQDRFMSARITNLLAQGYTAAQIADLHRNGSTTAPGSTNYKRPGYVQKFISFIQSQ